MWHGLPAREKHGQDGRATNIRNTILKETFT